MGEGRCPRVKICVRAFTSMELRIMMTRKRTNYRARELSFVVRRASRSTHQMGQKGEAWEFQGRRGQGIHEMTETQ